MVTAPLIGRHLHLIRALAALATHALHAPVEAGGQAWVEWVQRRARLVSRVAALDPPHLAAETNEALGRDGPAREEGRGRCLLNACQQCEQGIAEVVLRADAAVESLVRGRLDAMRGQLVRRAQAQEAWRRYLAAARQGHARVGHARSSNWLAGACERDG